MVLILQIIELFSEIIVFRLVFSLFYEIWIVRLDVDYCLTLYNYIRSSNK